MLKAQNEIIISGTLVGYWEQGMEGRIEYAFLPGNPQNQAAGGWPIWIENGQYLRIFEPNGEVLWAGVVKLVPRRWFIFYEQHDLPAEIWNDFKQKGVPYRKWIAWFWQQPPLRAELILPL